MLTLLIISNFAWSQAKVPINIVNNSGMPDSELFVAIVGEDLTGPPGKRVWVDCKTGNQVPMESSYNTVQGPIYNGNKGPGGSGKYANCFTKLSDIPNKTISLAGIQGCRMFIATGQQLYLYFFGPNAGYTSPNSLDPTDPNKGIVYEIIELTSNTIGFWANTTRVDSYNYAVGLEVWGNNNYYGKAGELKRHADIGAAFKATAPTEFKGCYDETTGAIIFPTKTPAFSDGTIGTMPNIGPYNDYFKSYIDAIWAKYVNEDMMFKTEDGAIWKGRIVNEVLTFTCQSGGNAGRKGIIARRPNSHEVFEGKGILNNIIQDAPMDLMMQAQMCAAITRHVINTTTPNVGLQDWADATKYYKTAPYNFYAKFFHEADISYNQRSYGFAYDDVFNHSSTLSCQTASKMTITFGGFAPLVAPKQEPYDGIIANIPGTIEAEKYDLGGEGLAFHETSATNEGGAFRTDAVDIEASNGGYNVGYITADEWLEYTVNVTAGKYRIDANVASTMSGKSFKVELDGNVIGSFTVPNTGGWSTYQTASVENVNLTAGKKTLRIYATTGDFNIDKLTFVTTITTGIDNNSSSITPAYPNPTTGMIQLDPAVETVELSDVNGKVISCIPNDKNQLLINNLQNGIYILKSTIGNQTLIQKMIKISE
jgi:hypothetical protein